MNRSGATLRPEDVSSGPAIIRHARRHRRWVVVIAIAVLALAARAVAIVVIGHPELLHGDLVLSFDEPSYHRLARTLAETGRYAFSPKRPPSAYRSPGTVLVLAGAYRVFGASPFVGVLCTLAASLALVFAVRRLAQATTTDPFTPEIAAAIAAVLPTLLWTSTGIWSEPLALLMTVVALLLLVERGVSHAGPGRWAAVGLCSAAAYLTRSSAVFLLPLLAIVAAAASGSGAQRARRTLAFVAAVVIPIATWGVRNYVAMGQFFTGGTAAGHTIWEANNPVTAGIALPIPQKKHETEDLLADAQTGAFLGSWLPQQYVPGSEKIPRGAGELVEHDAYVALARDFVVGHPGAAVRLIAYKFLKIFSAESVPASVAGGAGSLDSIKRAITLGERWFLLVFGAAGLLMLRDSRRETTAAYAVFVAAGLASVFVAYVNARFLLPVTTVLIVPAAFATSLLAGAIARRIGLGRAR
jgi:4-amino-4-deoxy-L-arabinose transferase-like glycosyltransferase